MTPGAPDLRDERYAELREQIDREGKRALDGLPPIRLTRRQQQIVDAIARGMRNKEIAHELGLTLGTVKVYISQLGTRIGITGSREICVWALSRKIALLEAENFQLRRIISHEASCD